ncbi:iron-sulfur cluster scaffold-like protein [Candidatus Mycoplasma haematominutum]
MTKYFIDDPSFAKMKPFKNPNCEDEMKIIVKSNSMRVEGIKVQCKGCALMKASINAVCLEIEDKPLRQAISIINNYLDMLNGLQYHEILLSENLRIMNLFQDSAHRMECILLGAESMKKVLTHGGS